MTPLEAILFLGGLVLTGTAVLLLPTIIAFARNHPWKWIAAFINVIFGVTGLGWVIAMGIALSRKGPIPSLAVPVRVVPPGHNSRRVDNRGRVEPRFASGGGGSLSSVVPFLACDRCGHMNPLAAHFCATCGGRLGGDGPL